MPTVTPVPAGTPVGDVRADGFFHTEEGWKLQALLASVLTAKRIFPITPSDTVDVSPAPTYLRVKVAGDLRLMGTDNTPVTIPVVVGETITLQARRVMATGTTATVVGFA